MDVWFQSAFINENPLRALSKKGNDELEPSCPAQGRDGFFPIESFPTPFTDSRSVFHSIVGVIARKENTNICTIKISISKNTMKTCEYNEFQIKWKNTTWKCTSDDRPAIACSPVP